MQVRSVPAPTGRDVVLFGVQEARRSALPVERGFEGSRVTRSGAVRVASGEWEWNRCLADDPHRSSIARPGPCDGRAPVRLNRKRRSAMAADLAAMADARTGRHVVVAHEVRPDRDAIDRLNFFPSVEEVPSIRGPRSHRSVTGPPSPRRHDPCPAAR